ncbi:hypothetical protein [Pseudonocardia sp. GCM10023141]|uniref:hypothetical protein n=1 Tax=Pseudonocardia sp. GCM10023141 TaxID=3252653 RepID=UPI00361BD769
MPATTVITVHDTRARWADLWVVAAVVVLIAGSVIVGRRLLAAGVDIFLGLPPLLDVAPGALCRDPVEVG